MTKIKFKILDMHCSNCVMTLEGIEDELPGIKWIKASYHHQNMEVEYDESLITYQEIVAAVQGKGYHPELA
jgi:copper chaperone CopZ